MGGRETQARSPQSARSRAEGKETSRKGEGADEGSRKGGQGREEGKGDPDFTPRLPLHPVRPSCPGLGAALGAQRPTSLCSSPPDSLHGTRHSLPLTISFTSHLVTCLTPRIPSRRRHGVRGLGFCLPVSGTGPSPGRAPAATCGVTQQTRAHEQAQPPKAGVAGGRDAGRAAHPSLSFPRRPPLPGRGSSG